MNELRPPRKRGKASRGEWRHPSSASIAAAQTTLLNEIAAWEDDRNVNHAKADWQFTTADAHIKLKHLYPSI